MGLRPLTAYQTAPYRPRILAIAGFVIVAVMFACSMPLRWVGVITESGSYMIADGWSQASWLLVVGVLAIALAVRLYLAPPGGFIRFVLVLLNFLVVLGMYIEYINNLGRAESYTTDAYLGAGFFIALGATGVLIASSILGWRTRDDWSGGADNHAQG